jgi:effector-binding domain-containing protein
MNIEVTNQESQIAVAIKKEAVRFDNMAGVMVEVYQILLAYIAQQGKQIAGAPYCKYTNGSEDFMQWDIELGVPVSEPLPEQDGMYMSRTCEGKAICAMHKGSYKDIDQTYTPMMEYLTANNLESTGDYYDYYISNRADTPENESLTQVVFPVK